MTTDLSVPSGLREQLEEGARQMFLMALPPFTLVVLGWTVLDQLLAPEHVGRFGVYRLAFAAISVALYPVGWFGWTRHRLWLLMGWVLCIAACLSPMLPVVSSEAFPFYVMGFSLCVIGLTSFVTLPPLDAVVAVGVYLLLFAPTLVWRTWDAPLVASTMFLATMVLTTSFQCWHHFRMARQDWDRRAALRLARDEAMAADEAKSSFLARMSHELRTPLNAIIGYAELAAEELEHPEPEAQRDLERIGGAGRHLLALINDVLDLSKIAAGELEVQSRPVELATELEEVHRIAERLVTQRRNRLSWSVEPGVTVWADPLRLRQVVLNLLSNAAKFTEDGVVGLRVGVGSGAVWVEVEDDGIGMDEEQLGRAFLPFVQVHDDHATYGGTGLGLSLCRQLVDRMGGELTAWSEPGRGSRFRATLPSQEGAAR